MSVEHFQRMINYMVWADRRLWQSIVPLPDEAIANPIDYSLGSLHEQVVHQMEAQWIWLERIKGFAQEGFTPASAYPNRESIIERWTRVQEAWLNYINALEDDDLGTTITYQRVRDKATFEMRLTDIIAHVINHATDHRAQMLALIASYGGQTFEQDYSFYLNNLPKEEQPKIATGE
jgi:uncharacterized damage-inducible protein DinB